MKKNEIESTDLTKSKSFGNNKWKLISKFDNSLTIALTDNQKWNVLSKYER